MIRIFDGEIIELTDAEIGALEAERDAHGTWFPPEPRLPNLEPDQFWFVVRASGYEPELLSWVASMNDPGSPSYDPIGWAAASAKLEFAKFFERDHPFVEEARQAMGMAEAELDALWAFGAGR